MDGFENLTSLEWEYCQVFPVELSTLKNLEELKLSSHPISAIPDILSGFEKLTTLELGASEDEDVTIHFAWC